MLSPCENIIANDSWDILPLCADKHDVTYLNCLIDRCGERECRDEIDFFFSEKVKIAKFSVLSLMSLIRERQFIRQRNLNAIDCDVDQIKTRLLNFDFLISGSYDDNVKAERGSLEEKLFGLAKEKRDEEAACWRDLMPLKKDLVLFMRDYKMSMLKKKALSFRTLENLVD